MFANFDWAAISEALPFLFLKGMRFTLMLTVAATIGGVALGTVLALMRMSSVRWLEVIAGTYVNFIRSIPLVLVIFWIFFLAPYAVQWITGSSYPVQIDPFWSAMATFTLFEAAYFCEIVRAGIGSISQGQPQASLALGMSYWQTMQFIVLPQAFRNMLPMLLTQTIILFQDTSLVYVVSIVDFLGAASIVAQRDGRLVEMYLFAAFVYFCISFLASQLVHQFEKRLAVIR